jgi:hypothetical protein
MWLEFFSPIGNTQPLAPFWNVLQAIVSWVIIWRGRCVWTITRPPCKDPRCICKDHHQAGARQPTNPLRSILLHKMLHQHDIIVRLRSRCRTISIKLSLMDSFFVEWLMDSSVCRSLFSVKPTARTREAYRRGTPSLRNLFLTFSWSRGWALWSTN